MIVIDGKAHRNMPEQVAKNQKDIEDIFKTLDGLNIQDNVVAIADLSHLLTQDELKIVERAVAFIVYNDHLFIKRDQDATNAYFDIVFSISGSTIVSFNSDEMQVNLTTGALTLVSNTFATYSKTELDTLLGAKASVSYVDTQLALKANLNGANFTGAITSPSIIENMSGYLWVKATNANVTQTDIYVGVVKNGNKLTLVYFGIINLAIAEGGSIKLGHIVIPSSVGVKLYPFTIGTQTNVLDQKTVDLLLGLGSTQDCIARITKASNTQIDVLIRSTDLIAETDYMFRYEATFLLSDNLAS